ncbi:MAG: prohibitin family protein [Myxococcota bacterium]
MQKIEVILGCALLSGAVGCAVVSPGERGVRQTFGKLGSEVHGPGTVGHWPFVSSVVTVPVRTTKLEMNLSLPSQEGVTVAAELSVLYRVKEDQVQDILESIGRDYERSVVLTAFRSASADIASRHAAKDLHSGARAEIEREIAEHMNQNIGSRGFEVEAVLLKSIRLPQTLAAAVQAKLAAEQQAQQMEFVLQSERQEADRRRVEAEGIRDAQRIVDQGLSPMLIRWRAIEAFRELAQSPNTKIIFTDGRTPLVMPPSIADEELTPSQVGGERRIARDP